jgi:hypothetical protein
VRTVIEQPRVSRALDDAKERWARAQDAWDTILWVIAHDPEGAGMALTESGATRSFTLDGARSIKLPTVTVLYESRLFEVVIHDAMFTDAKFAQAGRA